MSPLLSVVANIRRLLTPAQRASAVALLGLMIIGMALETLSAGLVIPAIALLTHQDLSTSYPRLQPLLDAMGRPSQAELILIVMLGLVGVYMVKNLFLAYLALRQTRFAFGVQAELSQRLFATYLRQPYTFHLQRNSAQLIRNVTGEVGLFTDAVVGSLNFATEIMVLLGISSLLLLVEPLGALISVLVLGGAAWGYHHATRARIARWGKSRQLHEGLRMQHLQQGLGGAKDVKLLGREDDFLAQYREHSSQSARVGQFQATVQLLPRLGLELLAVVGLATLAIAMLAQGRMATIVPTLGLFAVAGFRLMPAVDRALNAVQTIRYNASVVNTLNEELKLASVAALEGRRQVPGRSTPAPSFQIDIRLANIVYTYPAAASPALNDLTICVRKGESVGFVGPSGSGKSTLVDIILGLLSPDAGQVAVDGKDIRTNLRAWQDQIGYVPQTIYLTDDSIRRNVAFGLPSEDIDDAQVKNAIQAAQLDEFVAGLPEGLETVVGERGIRLSGGQRQRIGIARALYHDPEVLVLDEATSALDTATEHGVMQAVAALQGRKTILIVAHRLSTVSNCGRLYLLERGTIAADTAREESMAHAPRKG